jgi:hypothetical protein
MGKITDTLGALMQRREKLLAERKADPLAEVERQIAEIQSAAETEARAKAEAEKAARLADLRNRETLSAEALITVCDALAVAQAEYVGIARELYRLGAQPGASTPPLQFDMTQFLQEWRARLQPPSADELRQKEQDRKQWLKVIGNELEAALQMCREADELPDKFSENGLQYMVPILRRPTDGTNEILRRVCQEFVENGYPWPEAAKKYVQPPTAEDK